jgi:FkbM family methyltransferase
MFRFPSKINALRFLREVGLPIGTVPDVGAHAETVELRLALPDKRHILFEPAAEFHAALQKNYAGMDYVIVPSALSDQDGEGNLRKLAITGGDVTHSMLVDPNDGAPSEKVRTMRLDTFMKGRNDPKPYLLKIDVTSSILVCLEASVAQVIRGAGRIAFARSPSRLSWLVRRGRGIG